MPSITYGGQSHECKEQESVLDCLTAHGVTIPSSCHAGLCQTCMMRAVKGKVPLSAKTGLKPTLAERNYFLACACYPEEDIEVALPETGVGRFAATVIEVKPLNTEIACLQLQPSVPLNYKAGQFINLHKDAATARSYSLASIPESDAYLQLHIRKIPKGLVSNWVHETLKPGDRVEISDATGDCFYVPGNPVQNILLIGTGSGLAPLYGIIRDALLQGHRGSVRLYHGCETVEALYLVKELRELSALYPNFNYTPCVSRINASQDNVPSGYTAGMVLDVALAENPQLSGWRVFLCGHPEMVKAGKREVFLAGASMQDIHADPFENASAASSQATGQNAPTAVSA
jgi:ferredoxin-NADP reductase/ferredoxin